MHFFIVFFLLFNFMAPSYAQETSSDTDGFSVYMLQDCISVHYEHQQNFFKVSIPNTLKQLSTNTFEGPNYILQILVKKKSELDASPRCTKALIAQKCMELEKKYLENNFRNKFYDFQVFSPNKNSDSIIWGYTLKPAADQRERFMYFFTKSNNDIAVSLSYQFFEATDLQAFKTIAGQSMSSLSFAKTSIAPKEVVNNAIPSGEQSYYIPDQKQFVFEGKFATAHNMGFVLLLEDASCLQDLFVKRQARWENIGNNQWIATITNKDLMTGQSDIVKFLFENAVRDNAKAVLLHRIVFNGIEISKNEVAVIAQSLIHAASLIRQQKR